MLTYFLTYLYLVFNSLNNKKFTIFSSILTLFIFGILIGFRYEIGMDWDLYLVIMQNAKNNSFYENILDIEPGFQLLNWIGSQFNQIYIINFTSALIFLSGLIYYSKRQSFPWLSLIISFPVLIIMTGLGFTRQSVALGIIFFSYTAIEQKNYIRAILLIVLSSTFHLSSIFLLTLFIPEIFRNLLKTKIFIFLIIAIPFFYFFFSKMTGEALFNYWKIYILNLYDFYYGNDGALFRIIPTFFSALILIINKNKFYSYANKNQINLYLRISYIVVLFFFILIFIPLYSTAIDRFTIYLFPLTIFVLNKTINFRFLNISRFDYHLIYISSFFIYSFIWLEIARHKSAYTPYQNYLFLN